MTPPSVLSLFAGIGGCDLAFERAGCTVVAQVESDPQCRAVLSRHYPHTRRHDDVRTYHAQPGEADIVVGGFPCQDLSVAGKRAGLAGERSGLFFEMVRVVDECRPAYVIWENVPGLLSANNGRDFGSVLMALDTIGYSGAWTMLDAQWFGVAQRRRRIFGVFAAGDSGAARAAEILSLRRRMSGHSPAGGTPGQTIAYALAAGAGGSKFGSGRQGQDTLILESRLVCGSSVRRLTPLECERLQGFPDGWTDGQSDSARYRMLGNAVAVPVVEWIARRLINLECAGERLTLERVE